MNYLPLGKTAIHVSEIGFGTSSLAGVFHPVTEKQAIEAVLESLNIGINYFDTAPLYGNTLAETRLGKALKKIPRDRYILATKAGRFHNDEFDFSASRVQKSFHESCKRLNTDYIDLFQVHDIDFAEERQLLDETLPKLTELKQKGSIRTIGITGLNIKTLKRIANQFPIDALLSFCRCSLIDNRLASLYKNLNKNPGIINASPLVMGLLTRTGPISWHPATKAMRLQAIKAVKLCEENDISIENIAIKTALKKARESRACTTLIGSANKDHVKQWAHWLEKIDLKSLEEESLLCELETIFEPIYNQDW